MAMTILDAYNYSNVDYEAKQNTGDEYEYSDPTIELLMAGKFCHGKHLNYDTKAALYYVTLVQISLK